MEQEYLNSSSSCQNKNNARCNNHASQKKSGLKRKRTHSDYAPLKHVGQGTFADIWEVCQGASHFALKTLRKGKCLDKQGTLDTGAYRRYNYLIEAEGKRMMKLNARDPKCRAQLVRCREMLLPSDVSLNLAAKIAGVDGKIVVGTCLVLELMGHSLARFIQWH